MEARSERAAVYFRCRRPRRKVQQLVTCVPPQ